MEAQGQVTQLLIACADGDREAFDRLFPLVYDELRRVAHNRLRGERPDHTLNTTALVHEAYLKLVGLNEIRYESRAHFFAIAAQAMRNILVTYAHRRNAQRRGGGRRAEPLDEALVITDQQVEDILALDEALGRLKAINERQHKVVEYRFFAGLGVEETATVLGVSPATVKRDWSFSRAWLNRELGSDFPAPAERS